MRITPHHTATHCNTLQQTVTDCTTRIVTCECTVSRMNAQHIATHRNTLHHTATYRNTLQHESNGTCECAASHKNAQHTATHRNTLQHATTHCYTLQCHTWIHRVTYECATHCNTLQHTATRCNTPQHTGNIHTSMVRVCVRHQWAMSHIDDSCHICKSNVKFEHVTSCTVPHETRYKKMWRETSKKSRRENRKNVMRKQQKIFFCCFLFTLQRCMINRAQYGVATISRLLKIVGLFCKRALQKRLYSAKETYNFRQT